MSMNVRSSGIGLTVGADRMHRQRESRGTQRRWQWLRRELDGPANTQPGLYPTDAMRARTLE